MRYFFLIFAICVVVTMAIAGKRGSISRKPPLVIFPDMDRQPKLQPQHEYKFFGDNRSSRLPVDGTIPRTTPYIVNGQQVYPFEESPINTGRAAGTTNFVETNPLPMNEQMLARGWERYSIYCTPCHGPNGDGKGVTSKYGMVGIGNFHDPRLVQLADGDMFNTITHGKNLMGAYGGAIAGPDRWAIIAYVRALQRSRLATISDVPADMRSRMPSPPPSQTQTSAPPATAAPKP